MPCLDSPKRVMSGLKATVEDQRRAHRDCCQHCCQAARQHLPGIGNCEISAQRTDRIGRPWTMRPLLRISRSGVGRQSTCCGTPGLFVPKPSRGGRCQRCRMPELGTIVRRCPLASAAGNGRRYSLGYSVPRWLLLDHLDANCRHSLGPSLPVPGRRFACLRSRGTAFVCPVAAPHCCTERARRLDDLNGRAP